MKKFRENNRTISLWGILAFILTIGFSCQGGGERQSEQDKQLEEAKQKTIVSLNQYKGNIEERISYIDEEMESANDEIRANLEESRQVLVNQREILEAQVEEVENASLDKWNEVVTHAKETLGEAQQKTNDTSRKVREMLDGETE